MSRECLEKQKAPHLERSFLPKPKLFLLMRDQIYLIILLCHQ